jgi:hypothetical protein
MPRGSHDEEISGNPDRSRAGRTGQRISKGKAAARKLLPVRILLKADESEGREAWSDEAIRFPNLEFCEL